jgi:hypothetical protein
VDLEEIFRTAITRKASDILFTVGSPAILRRTFTFKFSDLYVGVFEKDVVWSFSRRPSGAF